MRDKGQDPVLKRAIRYLEKKHPALQDNLYIGTGSSSNTHHLDDLAHHASLVGLISAVVIQFFRVATFVNKDGKWSLKLVETKPKDLLEMWLPIIISGLFNWLVYIAEEKAEDGGTDIPKPIKGIAHLLASAPAVIQILKVADDWCLHLYSDVAGSQSSKGRGAGIPGLFVSFLKELSSVPPLNKTKLPELVEYLYKDLQVDLRKELGVLNELGRQSIPVIINEVLVRSFYFVRRLTLEYQEHKNWQDLNWNKVIPFKNRTIARMMTIASGTFTAIDMADAAIHGAAESGGNPAGFAKGFIVRVNFVGIGRFAVAVGTDIGMGIKREKLRNERMKVMAEQLALLNVKLFYQTGVLFIEEEEMFNAQKQMWIAAKSTIETLDMAYKATEDSMIIVVSCINDITDDFEKISSYRAGIEEYNPSLTREITDILRYGGKR